MKFEVVEQNTLVPQKPGYYLSFPSMAIEPETGDVLILYRQGVFQNIKEEPGQKSHGDRGNLYIKRYHPKSQQFSSESLFARAEDFPPGLIDGSITSVNNTLFCLIRSFPAIFPVFYTQGQSIKTLKPFQHFYAIPHFSKGAQWGKVTHIEKTNYLLQPYYGATPQTRKDFQAGKLPHRASRPAVYRSIDGGESWHFLAWMGPVLLEGCLSINETAIVASNNTLFALMRTLGKNPCPLFFSISHDHGLSWSRPQPSGLFGQAPIWLKLPSGKILAGFRGYTGSDPATSGTFSICEFDPHNQTFLTPFVVDTYHGDHYDGGYGDMVWIEESQQLFITYYYADNPEIRNPWLKYAFINIIAP